MSSPATASPPLKERAHALIEQLPDDATWADLAHEIAVIQDIEAGLLDSDADRVVDTETLRRHFGLPG